MLGRKRFDLDSQVPINVYVKLPSIQSVNQKLKDISKKLSFEFILEKPCSEHYKRKLIKNYWCSEDYNKLFGFQFKADRIFLYNNSLAPYKFYNEATLYEYLKAAHANTQAYIDCLRMWLGDNIKHISNEKIQSDTDNLIDYLNINKNCNIVDRDAFYDSFLELYKIYCYNIFMKQTPQQIKQFKNAINIRKGTTRNKCTINQGLKLLQLPYRLDKENNFWILHKLPE